MSLHELAGPRQPYESYIRRQDAATPPHLSTEPPGSAQVKGRQIAQGNAQLTPTTEYG